MSDTQPEQEVNLEQSGYDVGVSLRVELTTLKTQFAELIIINKALLTKLEQQHVMLGSIAKFVKENSASMPSFGVGR